MAFDVTGIAKRLLILTFFLAVIGGMITIVSSVFNSMNVVKFDPNSVGPDQNPLYETVLNVTATEANDGVAVYDYVLKDGKPQFSEGYTEYKDMKTANKKRQELVNEALVWLFGGIFMLSIVLEVLGIEIGSMMKGFGGGNSKRAHV